MAPILMYSNRRKDLCKNASSVRPFSSFGCQYCPLEFSNRDDHCRHLIIGHKAGVMCSYCNIQLIAPPGDDANAFKVLREHIEREHKSARHWTCIYCGFTANDQQGLEIHHKTANHRLIWCGPCKALMPTYPARRLHRKFQHKLSLDATDQPSRQFIAWASEGLCLRCFRRYPLASLRWHLLAHVKQERVSCNECFDFIHNREDVQKHMACFGREAKRHDVVCTGGNSTLCVCHCGFCASNQEHLARHNDWCHNEKTASGFAETTQHICMPPDSKGNSTEPGQFHGGELSIRSWQPAASQAPIDSTTGLALDVPNSPEVIKIEEDHSEFTLAGPSTTAAPTNQFKGSSVQTKAAQKATLPWNDWISSTAPSNDGIPTKETTPVFIPKTMPVKLPAETKFPTSGEQAKRPRVQSTATISMSTSSSSSGSEDEQPRATKPEPKIQGPAAARRQTTATAHGTTSSSSSHDDESVQVVQKKSAGTKGKTTPPDPRPKSSTIFKINDTNTVGKRKSANGVQSRQNVFAAAANVQKDTVESVAHTTTSKRKTHDVATVKYVCTICDVMESDHRGSVIRHLEEIHRVPHCNRSKFCGTRELPEPAIDDEEEEEEDEGEEQSSARSIAAKGKKARLDSKFLQEKVQSMEEMLAKMSSKIEMLEKEHKE